MSSQTRSVEGHRGAARRVEARRAVADATAAEATVAGFTLVELLVALAIVVTMVGIGLPALNNLISRGKLEGQARSLSVLVGRARNEAVTHGAETVVQLDGDSFVAYVDRDGATAADPPDGLFNPVAGSPYRASDWELSRLPLDSALSVAGPAGEAAIDGLVNPDRPDLRVIFNPDGTLYSTGAFRLTDPRDNFLEVAVGPRATGQVTLRKWDGSAWREQDEGDESWQWN